jgi:hypothetical protein
VKVWLLWQKKGLFRVGGRGGWRMKEPRITVGSMQIILKELFIAFMPVLIKENVFFVKVLDSDLNLNFRILAQH